MFAIFYIKFAGIIQSNNDPYNDRNRTWAYTYVFRFVFSMTFLDTNVRSMVFVCGLVAGFVLSWISLSVNPVPVDAAVDRTWGLDNITANQTRSNDVTLYVRGVLQRRKENVTLASDAETINVSTSDELSGQVRVLCWVMTSPDNLETRARHVRDTWARRCDKTLFVSDYADADFPTIDISVPHGRQHLTAKTMRTFDYIYQHHLDDADWFLKADDDTYVIVENLRYMLSAHSPQEPVFFGHHFDPYVEQVGNCCFTSVSSIVMAT